MEHLARKFIGNSKVLNIIDSYLYLKKLKKKLIKIDHQKIDQKN